MGATANDAAALETQLKALILHEDGGLAVQNLAMNALSTMLPRIEGTGQWGKARWRLSGATPFLFTLPVHSAVFASATCKQGRRFFVPVLGIVGLYHIEIFGVVRKSRDLSG